MTDRICSMPECGKKHLAKGLCGTHYNQLRADRHVKVERPCAHCGTLVMKYPRGEAKAYCSWECQRRDQWGAAWAAKALVLHPNPWPRMVPPVAVAPQPRMEPRRTFVAGRCMVCAACFLTTYSTAVTCSDACAVAWRVSRRQAARYVRRARERDAYREPVFRAHIFERDGWQCGRCMHPVKRDAVVPDPLAPTIDHIVPLSLGGTHEPMNVRLLCFMCNSTRGNRIDDELDLLM